MDRAARRAAAVAATGVMTVAAALGMAQTAAASTGDEEPPAPTYETQRFYFECGAPLRAQSTYGMSRTEPKGSFPAQGCVSPSTLPPRPEVAGLLVTRFEGLIEGAIDDINVELHDLVLGTPDSTLTGSVPLDVVLEVDGNRRVDTRGGFGSWRAPATSTGPLSQKIEFSITDLDTTLYGTWIRLEIHQSYTNTAAAWAFGAKEFPAGIEINPAELKATTWRASRP